jgi:hypothetical protein
MLEITGNDIAALADDDLRALVARLCEAEMRKRGHSAAAVTWGGAQDAPDGGIDVRVELPAGTPVDGFVARAATGFQVKKPDMPPAEIKTEMKPGGVLRPSIQDLAGKRGGYIIVSSTGSTADEALARRREAMAAAIEGIPNGDDLAFDFYDRTRIATWLRDHLGLVPWAREKAGRPIAGWQSFGAWANPAEGTAGDYLADNAARIRTGTRDGSHGITAAEGINRIRDRLRQPKESTRLVGLSGVGKTRLAQALFDDRVGAGALDPALAIYTNLSDGPEPSPVTMLSNILAAGTRLVMVVDNCPPDLHRRLAEIASGAESHASILTIEYIAWCDLASEPRYPTMASVVSYMQGSEEEPGPHWSGVALKMMARAPDPVAVARVFVKRFRPSGWKRAAKGPKKAHLLPNQYVFVRLLRSLAYEPALFARCAELLADFAILEDKESESEAGKTLTSLFFAYLSGTHATVEQRVGVMEGLIRSADAKRQSLGLQALKSLLETWSFISVYDFQFGSRSRDHGYHPNFEQLGAWCATVLRAAEAIALSNLPTAAATRCIMGGAFHELWTNARVYDDLERVSRALLAKSYWREGWIAARETLRLDGAGMNQDVRQRLVRLEQELRPRNLVQKVVRSCCRAFIETSIWTNLMRMMGRPRQVVRARGAAGREARRGSSRR